MKAVRGRRKICFYQVATHLGGAERSTLELIHGLKEGSDYEPWVLLPRAEGPLVAELEKAGINFDVVEIPESFFQMSRQAPAQALQQGLFSTPAMSYYIVRVLRLMRRRNPHLIHSGSIKCHGLSALLGPLLGIPVLWHVRDIMSEGPVLWALRSIQKLGGIRVVANSKATADAFRKGDSSISVVHNGLNPDHYPRKRHREYNEALGLAQNVPIVGILGVLARWKGQVEFLQMAERLLHKGIRAGFVIAGGEIYDTLGERGFTEALKEEAGKRGIAHHVLFTGFVSDPAKALGGMDILVHASVKPEPFGRVVVEGLACHVPVVASADGGIPEILEDGKSGLLFRPGDISEMSGCVENLLANQSLAEALSENGYRRFIDHFTRDRHVDQMVGVYARVLGSRLLSRDFGKT